MKPSQNTTKHVIRGVVFIVAWTIFIMVLLFAPLDKSSIPILSRFDNFDKVVHFFLFAISGLINVLGAVFFKGFKARVIFAIVFGLSLAIGSEFVQSFLVWRSMSLYDLLADVLGLVTALGLYTILIRKV